MSIATLHQQRNEALSEAKKLVKEDREMTSDEKESFDGLMSKVNEFASRIGSLEALDAAEKIAESDASRSAGRISKPKPEFVQHAEKKGYSICRAIASFLEKGRVDGVEGEVSQEIANRSGKQPTGFYLPYRLNSETRTTGLVDTTTGTGAVPTLWSSDFIDILRNKMLGQAIGCRFLTGLQSTTRFPRQNQAGTAYWVAESGAPSTSNQTIDYVALTPRTLGAYTDISRRFVITANVDAENFVRSDLSAILAIELDRAIFAGTGASNQPTGVLYNSNITGIVDLGTGGGYATWAKVVELEKNVNVANALTGKLSYVTSPQGLAQLKTIVKAASYPVYLVGDDGKMNGYPVAVSNQIPANLTESPGGTSLTALMFANWDDSMVGFFGDGVDILVDPYTGSSSGAIRIVALVDADTCQRHNGSFSYASDMKTS